MFPEQSFVIIIILACMCSEVASQKHNNLHKYSDNYRNKTILQHSGNITQVTPTASNGQPRSSWLKYEGDGETKDQQPFVPGSFDHNGASQGSASSTVENVLAGVLQSALQTPLLFRTVMENRQGDGVQSGLKTVVSKGSVGQETPLLSTLEEVSSEVQYFLSPEGLASEDRCTADVSAYLQGLEQGQMWALQMLDASGKPGRSILQGAIKFLGNYDECLEVSHTLTNEMTGESRVINGGYCHFLFTIPAAISNLTNGVGPLPYKINNKYIQWDLCLPASCNDSQVTEAASRLPLNVTGSSVVSAYFSKMTDWKEDSPAVAAVVVLCFIVALSLVGTLYDVISAEIDSYRRKRQMSESEPCAFNNDVFLKDDDCNDVSENDDDQQYKHINNAEEFMALHPTEQDSQQREGFGRQLLLSFSIRRNTEKILSTRTGDGNLGCIHGIRVLSMAWVILGHSMTWDSLTTWENMFDYANWMRRFTMQFLVNGTLSVDTFFVLSGCLLAFLFLRECEKSARGKPTARQMIIYYIHRWWRLTPVYMFIILFYSGLLGHLIQGPVAEARNVLEKDNCRENWWTNILYINNFFSFKDMCFPASWFLADDMQFYMIAPLALLPIAFGIRWLGYGVMCLFGAIHIGSYGYLEWKYGGATLFVGNADAAYKIYILPWCRVGVFAVGMILGAILQRTKCHIRIPRCVLVLGWQVALTIGLLCTYLTYDDFGEGQTRWDMDARIVHESLYRPLWGVFVSWVILVCCTGHGGFVNSLLSWSAWIPLGRLTYGAYLAHPVLLSYTEFSVRSLRYADVPYVSYHFLGTFIVSYALSFITCVLVESPCLGLEKAVLGRLKK